MGRLFIQHLDGRVYSCRRCGSTLASVEELLSKAFHSRNGKAYLFNSVVNITLGKREERLMTTGLHEVSDLCCRKCAQLCGWKYEIAHEEREKYKEGKYILERSKLTDMEEGYLRRACPAAIEDSDSDDCCRP